jgi:hypothetical protein
MVQTASQKKICPERDLLPARPSPTFEAGQAAQAADSPARVLQERLVAVYADDGPKTGLSAGQRVAIIAGLASALWISIATSAALVLGWGLAIPDF